jgi:hypothetical protein
LLGNLLGSFAMGTTSFTPRSKKSKRRKWAIGLFFAHVRAESFRFVPPTGWRVSSDPEQHRVVMHSPGSKASNCLAISMSKSGPKSSDSLDELREKLRHRFAGAVIAEEFSC